MVFQFIIPKVSVRFLALLFNSDRVVGWGWHYCRLLGPREIICSLSPKKQNTKQNNNAITSIAILTTVKYVIALLHIITNNSNQKFWELVYFLVSRG